MLEMESLNANQREAAEWNDGPMLVLAGPGSGKTLVLTMRVARLIQESPGSRFKVLGLTFTAKAADEMRVRVSQRLGPEAQRVHLTTFHSFALEVLGQHGSHFGLRPDFNLLIQSADRLQVLDQAIKQADVPDLPTIVSEKSIEPMIDRLLREGHDGKDVPLPFQTADRAWIRSIYNAYIRLLISENYLDFGTLLVCCLRLFRERPKIAQHYRTVYPFACVDEYQDTNKVQELLLRTLYPDPKANLFVVADDDQTIYQWNGASLERLRQLQDDYDIKVVQLPESFRCPPDVIERANALIRHNLDRTADKEPLISTRTQADSDVVRIAEFRDCEQEMAWIASDIGNRSCQPGQCAILARNKRLLECAAEMLKEAGLSPYLDFAKRKNEFESPLLSFIHSALRLANAPGDGQQLVILCRALRDLSAVDVQPEDAAAESSLNGGSLLRGVVGSLSRVGGEGVAPLLQALRDHLLERLMYRDFVQSVFKWRASRRDACADLDPNFDEETEERKVWNGLENSIQQKLGGNPTLNQFLQELDLNPKASPPASDEVQCLTIHRAKGKEFQHVYLIGLTEGQLPSYHAIQSGDRAIEEERRNCFVAITRTQVSLTLTRAESYFGWPKQPSRFLREMGLLL